jgi:hypothetical protein
MIMLSRIRISSRRSCDLQASCGRIESFEVCLLALAGGDRLIEVIANMFPRTGAVS